jgi:hypothetical protein
MWYENNAAIDSKLNGTSPENRNGSEEITPSREGGNHRSLEISGKIGTEEERRHFFPKYTHTFGSAVVASGFACLPSVFALFFFPLRRAWVLSSFREFPGVYKNSRLLDILDIALLSDLPERPSRTSILRESRSCTSRNRAAVFSWQIPMSYIVYLGLLVPAFVLEVKKQR